MPPKRKNNIQEPKQPPYKLDDDIKQSILEASYIGKKGYTVPISVLPEKELAFLKTDLFLKPHVPGPAFAQTTETAFPVYRENPNKIYIPRFYGIERYGTPERNELDDGEDICVSFPRKLRDYKQKLLMSILRMYQNQTTPTVVGELPKCIVVLANVWELTHKYLCMMVQ